MKQANFKYDDDIDVFNIIYKQRKSFNNAENYFYILNKVFSNINIEKARYYERNFDEYSFNNLKDKIPHKDNDDLRNKIFLDILVNQMRSYEIQYCDNISFQLNRELNEEDLKGVIIHLSIRVPKKRYKDLIFVAMNYDSINDTFNLFRLFKKYI